MGGRGRWACLKQVSVHSFLAPSRVSLAYRCDSDKETRVGFFFFLGKNLFYVWVCVVVCVLWHLWESVHPELGVACFLPLSVLTSDLVRSTLTDCWAILYVGFQCYSWNRGLLRSGLELGRDPPSYGIIPGMYYHAWLAGWLAGFLSFFLSFSIALDDFKLSSLSEELGLELYSRDIFFFYSKLNESCKSGMK